MSGLRARGGVAVNSLLVLRIIRCIGWGKETCRPLIFLDTFRGWWKFDNRAPFQNYQIKSASRITLRGLSQGPNFVTIETYKSCKWRIDVAVKFTKECLEMTSLVAYIFSPTDDINLASPPLGSHAHCHTTITSPLRAIRREIIVKKIGDAISSPTQRVAEGRFESLTKLNQHYFMFINRWFLSVKVGSCP